MSTETTERKVGQVKWFNNKAGYGFITVSTDGVAKDIFTHYSTIQVANSQYKYLVQGEYVEFDLVNSTNDKHEVQAVNVTGINRGPLMCETRRTHVSQDSERGGGERSERPSNYKKRPIRTPRAPKPEDSADEPADTPADATTTAAAESATESEFKQVVSKKRTSKTK
jgi:cold shock CspA family protein